MTGRSHAEERGRRFAFPASPRDRDACSRSERTGVGRVVPEERRRPPSATPGRHEHWLL